jgi:hypothetical protein
MFRDYVKTQVYPWEATTNLVTVQELQVIWDIVFPNIQHTVATHGDPVYYLVRNFFLIDSYTSLTIKHHVGNSENV